MRNCLEPCRTMERGRGTRCGRTPPGGDPRHYTPAGLAGYLQNRQIINISVHCVHCVHYKEGEFQGFCSIGCPTHRKDDI